MQCNALKEFIRSESQVYGIEDSRDPLGFILGCVVLAKILVFLDDDH